MKQGERKRKLPKDKRTKVSWQKRNEARKTKQDAHVEAAQVRTSDYYREADDPLRPNLGPVENDALFHAELKGEV